jgi:hypothetical protein
VATGRPRVKGRGPGCSAHYVLRSSIAYTAVGTPGEKLAALGLIEGNDDKLGVMNLRHLFNKKT